jgi:hypothetical protein
MQAGSPGRGQERGPAPASFWRPAPVEARAQVLFQRARTPSALPVAGVGGVSGTRPPRSAPLVHPVRCRAKGSHPAAQEPEQELEQERLLQWVQTRLAQARESSAGGAPRARLQVAEALARLVEAMTVQRLVAPALDARSAAPGAARPFARAARGQVAAWFAAPAGESLQARGCAAPSAAARPARVLCVGREARSHAAAGCRPYWSACWGFPASGQTQRLPSMTGGSRRRAEFAGYTSSTSFFRERSQPLYSARAGQSIPSAPESAACR